MPDKCPGSRAIRTPVPCYKKCPQCGEVVEIWSDELKAKCTKCNTLVFRQDTPSCIEWCRYVRECLGEEKYNRLMEAKTKAEANLGITGIWDYED